MIWTRKNNDTKNSFLEHISMTGLLTKRGDLGTDTHRRTTVFRDTGRRQPFISQGERPKTDSFLTGPGRNRTCRHVDVTLLTSRTVRGCISVVQATQFAALHYSVLGAGISLKQADTIRPEGCARITGCCGQEP